ncbi:MAG: hypothetical protein Q8K26_00135, partial [Candidatus Gracilibacteria bacterium]|nr:hypothetical protein [Candidatus Gracilibacteria bacterium]
AKNKNKYFIVVDGKKQKEFPYRVDGLGGLQLSADGKSFAYVVKYPDFDRVVKNDSSPLDGILPIFSPDGDSFAYVKVYPDNSKSVVNNGIEGKIYKNAAILRMKFSPNGKNLSYILFTETDNGSRKYFVVKDEILSIGYDSMPIGSIENDPLKYSEDSRHLEYTATKNGNHIIVMDGKEVGLYTSIIDRGFYEREVRFVGIGNNKYDLLSCPVYNLSDSDRKIADNLSKKLNNIQISNPKKYQDIIRKLSVFLGIKSLSDKNYFIIKEIFALITLK